MMTIIGLCFLLVKNSLLYCSPLGVFSPSAEDLVPFSFNCNYQFPSRYNQYQDWSYTFTYDAAIDTFRGRPRLLKLSFNMTEKIGFLDFLSDFEYLEIHVSKKRTFKAAQRVIEKATKCKFLFLEYSPNIVSSTDIVKLPKPNLHVLIVSKLVLTQESLHQLLLCFLTLPCGHPQMLKLNKVSIKGMSGKIECNRPVHHPQTISYWPELEVTDRRYLHLKTVEIQNSTIKTSELVLQWPLGSEGKRKLVYRGVCCFVYFIYYIHIL